MSTGYLDYYLCGYAGTPLSDREVFRVLMDAMCTDYSQRSEFAAVFVESWVPVNAWDSYHKRR